MFSLLNNGVVSKENRIVVIALPTKLDSTDASGASSGTRSTAMKVSFSQMKNVSLSVHYSRNSSRYAVPGQRKLALTVGGMQKGAVVAISFKS